MYAVFVILSIVLAVAFAYAGVPKVGRSPRMVDMAEHLRYPVDVFQTIGVLEATAALGLLIGIFWQPLGVAAAFGLVALLVGAVLSHLRVHDEARAMISPTAFGVLALATGVIGLAT